ncbi:hypothetical protein HHX47_DHR4001058, partial [Lentinula edodes]
HHPTSLSYICTDHRLRSRVSDNGFSDLTTSTASYHLQIVRSSDIRALNLA